MHVYNKGVQRISQIYQGQRKNEVSKARDSKGTSKDQVTLSNQGKEIQAALRQVAQAPEIREEAEQLKVAVKSGTYQVSGEQIAASILKSLYK